MKLETQIQKLADLGLPLNEGITIDDLLYSFDRGDFEKKPFNLILFALGIEVEKPPYAPICDKVWNFDTECITSTGDYVRIVKQLCKLSGDPDYLTNISDHIDFKTDEAWLKYQFGKVSRNWIVELDGDWVDRMTISYVIDDIERDGKRFYYKDNGQAMILFYLDEVIAKEINDLSGGALETVNVV